MKLLWARRISIFGGYIFGAGVIYSFATDNSTTAHLISIVGIAITIIGLFYGFNFISCPRCSHSLGKEAFFQSNISFKFKKEIKVCPYCSLSLNKNVTEALN